MENSYIFSKESSSYISGNRNPEKIPYISQKRAFLIFSKTETPKISLYFRKQNFLIFQEVTFRARKVFLIYREMELSSPKLKKLLIFQEELSKPQKPKFPTFLQKKL